MVGHDTFPQTFCRFLMQLSRADVRHRRHVNSLFKQYKCADLFTLRFPHLPSQRGN